MKRRIYIAFLEERRCYRDQYKVVQPYQGGGSDTVETEERTDYKQVVQWEKGNMTSHSLDPDAAQWSSRSSWTWSPSTRSSWWDYSSPLQSWRHSHHDQPQLTSQQTSWTVQHVLQNTSTGRPGVVRQISERSISKKYLRIANRWMTLRMVTFTLADLLLGQATEN